MSPAVTGQLPGNGVCAAFFGAGPGRRMAPISRLIWKGPFAGINTATADARGRRGRCASQTDRAERDPLTGFSVSPKTNLAAGAEVFAFATAPWIQCGTHCAGSVAVLGCAGVAATTWTMR